MNSTSYEYKNKSASRGAQCAHINANGLLKNANQILQKQGMCSLTN